MGAGGNRRPSMSAGCVAVVCRLCWCWWKTRTLV